MNNEIFDAKQASKYLKINEGLSDALRMSRSTGKLWGLDAPKFLKGAAKVLYRKSDLDAFISKMQVIGGNTEAEVISQVTDQQVHRAKHSIHNITQSLILLDLIDIPDPKFNEAVMCIKRTELACTQIIEQSKVQEKNKPERLPLTASAAFIK